MRKSSKTGSRGLKDIPSWQQFSRVMIAEIAWKWRPKGLRSDRSKPLLQNKGLLASGGSGTGRDREPMPPDGIAEIIIAVAFMVGNSSTLHKLPIPQLSLRNPACLNTFRKNRTHPSIASEARPRACYNMPERVRQDV